MKDALKHLMQDTTRRLLNADPDAFVGDALNLAMLCTAIITIFSLPVAA
jgi:hypothetical protein